MDIVRFKGGLGNQMFQYAFVEALRSLGRDVYCSLGFYRNYPNSRPFILDKVFQGLLINEIDDEIFNAIDGKWKTIKKDRDLLKDFMEDKRNRFFYVEKESGKYESDVFLTENCTFVGYWQSEKYFKKIKKELFQLYSFRNIEIDLLQFGNYIKNKFTGIHIRRGDYLQIELYKHNICTIEYYIKAMDYMKKVYNSKFIIFTDDLEWAKENFDERDSLICDRKWFNNYQDWYDMYLMTLCKGNIISNSSFGWWGAWLNQNSNNIVITPSIWLKGNSTPDIWCDGWVKL